MKKILSLIIVMICLLVPLSVLGEQDRISPGMSLNLRQCIEIALKKHPDLTAAFHTVRIGDSRIGQARSDYYPQVNFQTGYDRSRPYVSRSGRSTGTSSVDQYAGKVSLNQNIYDFGRTSARVRIAGLNRDSSREDLEDVRSLIVLDVKQAYYGVLQTLEKRRVAEESVAQFQQHLNQARGFFEVGLKPKFDVTKAEVDLSNARLELTRAENAVRIARVNLNNAMGMPGAPEYSLEDNLFFEKTDISLEKALAAAYENRPDLRSLVLREEAARQNLDLARTGHYPTLTGSASYGYGGSDFPLGEGWNVGGSLNIPIFSGFLVENQIFEAKENIEVFSAEVESLKQRVRLEVEQALSNLQEAAGRIETAEVVVRQAEENRELAEGRYTSGVGNPIEVTDALQALRNAKVSRISALADYKSAQADLENAMGMK
ncbi:MAG TPA: TolC family protein [Syntrophales bacterium]|jgi:TolC family type I secretion outer membrane protein|nr:TolC family protein [Syntrophales bacterium]